MRENYVKWKREREREYEIGEVGGQTRQGER